MRSTTKQSSVSKVLNSKIEVIWIPVAVAAPDLHGGYSKYLKKWFLYGGGVVVCNENKG